MVEVSIICLIYKSCDLADKFYDSLIKHTPMLKNGSADFMFVANDPTDELINHLKNKHYPFIINCNEILSKKEMFKKGFALPEYIRRIYQGYNCGIINAKGKRVVLVNSDNFFSDDWLENLLKYSEYKNIVSSTLVEPGTDKYDVFFGAIKKNFGRDLKDYDDEEFQKFANKIRKTGLKVNGAYMPCLFYKDAAFFCGLYPEGNLAGESFEKVKKYGDEYFFEKMQNFGIKHYTSKDSIVYHLKEGEKALNIKNNASYICNSSVMKNINSSHKINDKNLTVFLKPSVTHDIVLDALLRSVSIIIFDYRNKKDIINQLNYAQNQIVDNKEIILLLKDKMYYDDLKIKYPSVKISVDKYTDVGTHIYHNVLRANGTYISFLSPNVEYSDNYIFNQLLRTDIDIFTNSIDIYDDRNKHMVSNESYYYNSLLSRRYISNNLIYWINVVLATSLIQGNNILLLENVECKMKVSYKIKLESKFIKYNKRFFNSIKKEGIFKTIYKISKKLKNKIKK